MSTVLFGIFAALVGLFLCLSGQWALRLLLAVWGAFVGFALGAGVVDAFTSEGFLATAFGWVAAIVLAILFSALAYLYYAISITLAMAGMGFVLGGSIAAALGATSTWLLVLVGVVFGVLLAALAILADLPQVVLIVLSALTGAAVLVGGLMLTFGVISYDEMVTADVSADQHPIWYVVFVVAALVGIVAQSRQAASLRATVRDTW